MNRPLLKTYLIVGIITRWQKDWQRSFVLEKSIVESHGVDTEDHPLFATENSQIGSQSMKDSSKKSMIMEGSNQVDGITIHVILKIIKEKVDYDRRK